MNAQSWKYHSWKHRSWRPLPGVRGLAAAVAAAVLLAACGSGGANPASSGTAGSASTSTSTAASQAASVSCTKMQPNQISFFNQNDASTAVEDAIAGYIAVNGYCYPSYKDYQLSSNVGNAALVNGQVDVNMELWRINFSQWYKTNTQNGKVLDVGETYESSSQGFYIPKYTQQAHPNITSVSDLAANWQLFKDPLHPKQGLYINCMVGWHCSTTDQIMLKAYGVLPSFYVETAGSEGAEKAAILGAYQKHQNFVFYWWTPDPFLAKINAVKLKEPAYTAACNALQEAMYNAISKGATLQSELAKVTPAYACAYQQYDIRKGVNAKWAAANPGFVAALKKMDIHDAPLNATMAYYAAHNNNAKAAALWFFGKYQTEWESWLPATQLARVKAALAKDGVQLSA